LRLLGVLAAAFGVCCVGCGRSPRASERRNAQPRPNIILISIDSLRADHLRCYGYERDTSPVIDALAADGALFEQAVAAAPWTLPSHASLLTSLHSRTHQANDPKRRFPRETVTLASVLKSSGYDTHAVVSGPFMQTRFGMNTGFETYDDELARETHRESHAAVTSPAVHAKAEALLGSMKPPFFLFLHYWDVHYDYIPPEPYARRFDPDYRGSISPTDFMQNKAISRKMPPRDLAHIVALYDGEIAWVDHHIGLLMDELKRRGLYDNAIIILTADHGDEFFEHGGKGHQHSLYEELLHVPWIIKAPRVERGRRIAQRVSLIDVMPTLLDALALELPPTLQGRSVWPPALGGDLDPTPVFSETTKARKSHRNKRKSTSWAMYSGNRKLILFDKDRYPPELYDLASDPRETRNLFGHSGDSAMLSELKEWFGRTPVGVAALHEGLDAATLRDLEALGYMGGGEDDDEP